MIARESYNIYLNSDPECNNKDTKTGLCLDVFTSAMSLVRNDKSHKRTEEKILLSVLYLHVKELEFTDSFALDRAEFLFFFVISIHALNEF